MESGAPSRTAFAAAVHRAAHQILEQGRIFSDPLAIRILGEKGETFAREEQARPERRRMRLFIAARTRFAEDALTAAIDRGVRQLVVLGAGLDTYAYRSARKDGIRVFEVDHPATQEWKRQLLEKAQISAPQYLTYAPVDFERQTLGDGLAAAGFESSQQTFFTWLGVVPYLTEDAVWSTLRFIANLSGGAHVVFDYANPPDSLSPEFRTAHQQRAQRVAEIGEPWITFFDSEELHGRLTAAGFCELEDLGPREILQRFFPGANTSVPEQGGHIIRATRV